MRKIYVDSKHKCHVVDDGTMTQIETNYFDGKCDAFVEGFCCEIGEDGTAIYSWKPYDELDSAQRLYEQALILDMQLALNTLGVNVDG